MGSTLQIFICLLFTLGSCLQGNKQHVNHTNINSTTVPGKGFKIKGIAVSAPPKKIDSTKFNDLVQLHANSVELMPYAFCRLEDGEVKFNHERQWWGERDEGVLETIRLAHNNKLSVMVKPHLWMARGSFTGAIDFDSEEKWLAFEKSYQNYILHFAALAKQAGAEMFCLGTELETTVTKRSKYFELLIDTVRKVFPGKILYASNWDEYEDFPFWDKLDYIGVDAYFPISASLLPTVDEIIKGWEPIKSKLAALSKKHNKQIVFTEFGYRNSNYTAKEPWSEANNDVNNEAQANALHGLLASFSNEMWFDGGWLWKWHISDDHWKRESSDIDFSPQGKPAIDVIKNNYGKQQQSF